jgi:predicted kinase
MARLVLLCGLPGSGKSTFATELAREQELVRFSPDQWKAELGIDFFDEPARIRVEGLQWRLALELLQLGQSVVLDNGFWTRQERTQLRNEARSVGARVELIFLALPFDELWRRIEQRNRESPPHAVPLTRHHLEHYATRFEPPDGDELALFDGGSIKVD